MTQRTLKADLSPDQPTPPPTKGLTQLDKERAESMADEGGAAAAVIEGPEPASSGRRSRPSRSSAPEPKKPRGRKGGRQ
jgi:hypothetical protein